MSYEKNTKLWTGPIGSTSLAMECIQLNKPYAFTLNLQNLKGQYQLDHSAYYKWIQKNLLSIKHLDFKFILEISKFGRIHMHGQVEFKHLTAIAYFYLVFYDIGCNFEFDEIKDPDKWESYMYKQKTIMQALANKTKQIYEFTNDTVVDEKTYCKNSITHYYK